MSHKRKDVSIMTKNSIASAASTFQHTPCGLQSAFSLSRNAIEVARGNKTVGAAARDVAIDTAKAGAVRYGASMLASTTAGAAISSGLGTAIGGLGLAAAAPIAAAAAPAAIAGVAISAVSRLFFRD